jgi:flagellar biosynthesis chaperone FliJ
MTKVLEPAVASDAIVFELERFEPAAGRLELSGRWFGVRGRRFMRPTLPTDLDPGRVRALADLDDKPWAAEDGAPWTASFPWESDRRLQASELSVAPDITIQLPAPRARRGRPERLPAVPRREAMTASWGDVITSVETPARADTPPRAAPETEPGVGGPEPTVVDPAVGEPESAVAEPDPAQLAAEVEGLRAQLDEASASLAASDAEVAAVRRQLDALGSELEEARRQLSLRSQGIEDAQTELTTARAAREAALRNAARAESERDTALTQAAQAEAERDGLAADQAGLRTTLAQTQAALETLSRERDHALAARGAALVMRGATRALPAHERHVGWLRRSLVVLVLIGVVFAALIVLHAL